MSDFDKAKNLLIGAVDAVLSLADQAKQESSREPCSSSAIRRPRFATFGSGRSAETPTREEAISQGASASMEEHRRLFGYRPAKGKGKRSKNVCGARRRPSFHFIVLQATEFKPHVHTYSYLDNLISFHCSTEPAQRVNANYFIL